MLPNTLHFAATSWTSGADPWPPDIVSVVVFCPIFLEFIATELSVSFTVFGPWNMERFSEDWKKRSWLNSHNSFTALDYYSGSEGSSWLLMVSQKTSFLERPVLSEIPLTILEVIQSFSLIRNCPWAVSIKKNKIDPLLTREDKRYLG